MFDCRVFSPGSCLQGSNQAQAATYCRGTAVCKYVTLPFDLSEAWWSEQHRVHQVVLVWCLWNHTLKKLQIFFFFSGEAAAESSSQGPPGPSAGMNPPTERGPVVISSFCRRPISRRSWKYGRHRWGPISWSWLGFCIWINPPLKLVPTREKMETVVDFNQQNCWIVD